MASVSPGADGLQCWPLLIEGATDTQSMRPGGTFSGIKPGHSASHLLRAVLEGLACELTRHLGCFTAAGSPVKHLVVSGPAAASSVVPQILADATAHPVTCLSESDISAFGAATIARALVSTDADLRELATASAPSRRTVLPGPSVEIYRDLYREYLAAFGDAAQQE